MINDPNPIQHFQEWFCEVRDHFPQVEVNAMALSTFGLDGFPKTRMVLLKKYTWEGFIFYTQYTSEKGKAMEAHSKVSLSFPWEKAAKRVSIAGMAEKIDVAPSEAYFETRPRGSQLSAWASHQSDFISSRETLEDKYKAFELSFENDPIPKPERWGGYLVRPTEIIFEEYQNAVIQQTSYSLINDLDWKMEIGFLPR